MLPRNPVSSAAANNPMRIIFAICNRGRSAAKRATNSQSHSAARITARSIVPATSRPGGRRPGSTPLRSRVTSGGKPGSTIGSITRRISPLIDPSVAPVRALPRNQRELFITANNGHILAFDNRSGLPAWLSDTLCRLTSGVAFSTRRLFTDQDEILLPAARPIILNGIEDIITRPDLADRAILLTLAPIAERQRRPEHTLWQEFELARP